MPDPASAAVVAAPDGGAPAPLPLPLSRRYPAPAGGGWDEMRGPEGAPRPQWQPLMRLIDELGPAELGRRWELSRELIHEHGVSFNVYGDAQGMERPWRLSPIPVVIAPDEFAALA